MKIKEDKYKSKDHRSKRTSVGNSPNTKFGPQEDPDNNEDITEFQGLYRWLSNFSSVQIEYDGLMFDSVEEAYQASKCADPSHRKRFQSIGPGAAKKMGRHVRIDPDFEGKKVTIMYQLVKQKFSKEPYKAWLLATGDRKIIEGNYWGDTFWGVCKGVGQNQLGKCIMMVRKELREESNG